MAITATQVSPLNLLRMATGRYLDTGAAAAFTITLGFKPRYIKMVNVGGGLASIEWFEGMADLSGVATATAGDITVDVLTGFTVTSTGFTLGIQAAVNITNQQLSWIALG